MIYISDPFFAYFLRWGTPAGHPCPGAGPKLETPPVGFLFELASIEAA